MNEVELINKDFRRLKINGVIYYDVPKDIYNAIEELQKENETLKHYRCKRNCVSRLAENRKLTDTEILDELEEWLGNSLILYDEKTIHNDQFLLAEQGVLNKIQELKKEMS